MLKCTFKNSEGLVWKKRVPGSPQYLFEKNARLYIKQNHAAHSQILLQLHQFNAGNSSSLDTSLRWKRSDLQNTFTWTCFHRAGNHYIVTAGDRCNKIAGGSCRLKIEYFRELLRLCPSGFGVQDS